MAIAVTTITGIEWSVNNGVVANPPEPVENPNYATGFEPSTEFIWNDVNARLVGGPEPLYDYWIQGKVFIDTRTIVTVDPPAENAGEVTSDTVARTYPPYVLTSMALTSTMTNDWVDSTNPAKPKQFGGPLKYVLSPNEPPPAAAGETRVGLKNDKAIVAGFVLNESTLPAGKVYGDNTFYINLENGVGYVWADGGVASGSWQWCRAGIVKDPAGINTGAVGSVNDLPTDAPDGDWALVANGVYGTVYQKSGAGWLNIGPVQGVGAGVTIPEEERKSYVSGYVYSLVFDRSDFRYVARLSGSTQDTYQGEVSIDAVGWFPFEPMDEERNIYPMDSITKFKPDDREFVTITYTATLTTNLITGTATVIQDVYQPTSDWGGLMNQLLQTCYFTHGIYH